MVITYTALSKLAGLEPCEDVDWSAFSDAASVPASAAAAISTLADLQIITGSGNQLQPNSTITRARLAVLFYRAINLGIGDLTYKTIPVSMSYQAGSAEYEAWTSGMTIHGGIGYLEPFGLSTYTAGINYDEAADYPISNYFSDDWMNTFGTSLFCIYHMDDGDLIVYDGIFGAMLSDDGTGEANRKDALVNIIVGGTGAYEGATGILIGQTEGAGEYSSVTDSEVLPESLWKVLSGYIKLPADSAAAESLLNPAS